MTRIPASPVTRFVALGDSTTAGFGDPEPGGGWRGWAALLAAGMPGADFHNLATSGARAADVAAEQLPAALALRPDLAAVLVGVNDTLRGDFDPATVAAALSRTVEALRGAGAVVLTGCLPDPGRMFRLPAALARPLGRRVAQVNAAVHDVAAGYRSLHLHIPLLPAVYDRAMWSIDRLHPGERGHRALAGAYFDLLHHAGFPVRTRPSPEPTGPSPTRRAQTWWLLTKGSRWLYARSTDLVPYLARLAWQELRAPRSLAVDHEPRSVVAAQPCTYPHDRPS